MTPARTAAPLLLAAALALTVGPAGAQETLEQEITERIEAETDCVVDYLSRMQDRRRADPPHVSARVHCRDGTQYDVEWQTDDNRFRFERCARASDVC
jgi:hypothetical protein